MINRVKLRTEYAQNSGYFGEVFALSGYCKSEYAYWLEDKIEAMKIIQKVDNHIDKEVMKDESR